VRTLFTGATLFHQTNYTVPDIGLAVTENYFSGVVVPSSIPSLVIECSLLV